MWEAQGEKQNRGFASQVGIVVYLKLVSRRSQKSKHVGNAMQQKQNRGFASQVGIVVYLKLVPGEAEHLNMWETQRNKNKTAVLRRKSASLCT